MSKFHSTVTRRDFMKALGLSAAGLGAASATAPVFHDLDEVISASSSESDASNLMNRPWWVKQVDKPTVDIDLSLTEPFTGPMAFGGVLAGLYVDADELQSIRASWPTNLANGINNKTPGSDHRDVILHRATVGNPHLATAPNEGFRSFSPESIGATKWQGTPEENSLMMRTVCRWSGFSWIGYVDLDDTSLGGENRKLYDSGQLFGDNDDLIRNESGQRVYPRSANRMISLARQTWGSLKDQFTETVRGCAVNGSYPRSDIVQNFLWGLGYKSFRPGGVSPQWGILSGMGEYNRSHGPQVTPEGMFNKISQEMITDLPLLPTKPIDMGVLKWCQTCGRCAEACPADAIPTKDEMKEPTWERATGQWSSSNNHKGYPNDSVACAKFWAYNVVGGFYPLPAFQCSTCTLACPFYKQRSSWIHDIVKGTVSTTPVLNSFFVTLDKFAGYGNYPSEDELEAFWSNDLSEFGLEPLGKNY